MTKKGMIFILSQSKLYLHMRWNQCKETEVLFYQIISRLRNDGYKTHELL